MKPFHAAVAVLAIIVPVASTPAAAEGLEGTWSGGGIAKPTNGQSERVRCKMTYSRETPKVYGVSAACATPSLTFHQTGKVSMVTPSRFVGDFYNPEFDVSGRVRVTLAGASQTVTFSGSRGSGSMTLSKR